MNEKPKIAKITIPNDDGRISGTGWLVTPELVLTCCHVIEGYEHIVGGGGEPKPTEGEVVRREENIGIEMISPSRSLVYSKPGVVYKSEELDYAILRLKENPDNPIYDQLDYFRIKTGYYDPPEQDRKDHSVCGYHSMTDGTNVREEVKCELKDQSDVDKPEPEKYLYYVVESEQMNSGWSGSQSFH